MPLLRYVPADPALPGHSTPIPDGQRRSENSAWRIHGRDTGKEFNLPVAYRPLLAFRGGKLQARPDVPKRTPRQLDEN